MSNTPQQTSPQPTTPVSPAAKLAEVEKYYGQFVGRAGYNPYFYLHSVDFFNISAKVKNNIPLTEADTKALAATTLAEANAKSPVNTSADLYRTISGPAPAIEQPAPNQLATPPVTGPNK